ncbi:putative porin [Paraburkholderia sp. BL8N3]|nr:porin [Paraburkholderia sp. BL8N3]TCK33289.1 putative porin [Paraburkholderia sp. BL8N3]
MKRFATVALVAAGGLPLTSHADASGVTLYGVLDAGILYKTNADAAGHRQTQLVSGGEEPSRWGLVGTENLGGGWAAKFRLESSFKINNGQFVNGGQPASAGTVLFDRGAAVSLANPRYGELLVGRNWTPFWESLNGSDASGWSTFGSLNNLSYQNLTGLKGGYYWADNSVKYVSPTLYGLRVSALYSFGGTAGDFRNRRVYSGHLEFKSGPVRLSAAYLEATDPTGATDLVTARAYNLGADYHFGGLTKFGATWTSFRNPATGVNQGFIGLTGSLDATSTTVLTGAYIHLADFQSSSRNADLFKLGVDHYLSKRTALYADVGYTSNGDAGTLGLQNVVTAGRAGDNQLGLMAGIRTRF